jgi:hypothetical protein
MNLKTKNKSGVSEMLSYILLIFITISLASGVYIWLKNYAVVSEKIDCKDGTSLSIEKYTIQQKADENKTITLFIKNNGLFNVSGFLLSVGNDSKRVPMQLVWPVGQIQIYPGYYDFVPELAPGQKINAEFYINEVDKIETIQMQSYILKGDKTDDKIFCDGALIKQEILVNPSLIPGLVSWWKLDGNVLDSKRDNNGLIEENPSYVFARLNQGLNFDGIDDAVNFTVSEDKTTISFWYKNSTESNWNHIVKSGGEDYVNGENENPVQSPVYVSGNYIYIGKINALEFFNGTIDEIAVYNKTLTEWEVLQLYNSYNITG